MIMVLAGCNTLPIDNSLAPIDHNFFSMDLNLCEQRSYGLNGCSFSALANLEDKKLSFNVYDKGTYSLRSSNCNYEKVNRYDQTGLKEIPLSELLRDRPENTLTCVFSLLVRPDGFSKSMQAKFILFDTEEFSRAKASILGTVFKNGVGWLQLRANGNRKIPLHFIADGDGTFYYQGCGVKGKKRYSGELSITINDLLNVIPTEIGASCFYSMYLVPDQGNTEAFMFILSVYDKRFIHLERPVIDWDKGKLCIKAKDPVGLVGIDNKYKYNKNKICKKVGDKFVFIGAATSSGRTTFLGIEKGEVVWEPLVR